MQLELSQEEREVLADALSSYVSNLRYEISDTDNYDYRSGLKAREETLNKILSALQSAD